jgi:hypothetical protein
MELAETLGWVGAVAGVAGAMIAVFAAYDARKSRRAAEKSAAAEERGVALLEAEAAERRAAAAPRVEWVVERTVAHELVLRNVGKLAAEDVFAEADCPAPLTRYMPEGVTIPPNSGHRMVIVSRVHELTVRWSGQDEPVSVPVPPKLW